MSLDHVVCIKSHHFLLLIMFLTMETRTTRRRVMCLIQVTWFISRDMNRIHNRIFRDTIMCSQSQTFGQICDSSLYGCCIMVQIPVGSCYHNYPKLILVGGRGEMVVCVRVWGPKNGWYQQGYDIWLLWMEKKPMRFRTHNLIIWNAICTISPCD